jgi:acetylornithine deacetylase
VCDPWRNVLQSQPAANIGWFGASSAPSLFGAAPSTGFTFEEKSFIPGLDMAADSEIANLARALSGDNGSAKVSFGTEAGLFQLAGIPTIVCGPGSIEQAHKPDEYIDISELRKCEAFMGKLTQQLV